MQVNVTAQTLAATTASMLNCSSQGQLLLATNGTCRLAQSTRYGTATNPARSCIDLFQSGITANGLYFMTVRSRTIQVYCDQVCVRACANASRVSS
jgi:hypothetical protein